MRHILSCVFLLLALSQHAVISSTVEAGNLSGGTALFSAESEASLSGGQKKFYESAGGKGLWLHKKLIRIQRDALNGQVVSLALFDNESVRLELQKQPGESVWKGRDGGMIRFSLRETGPGRFGGYLIYEGRRYVIRSVGDGGLVAFYEEVEEPFQCGSLPVSEEK